MTTPAGGRRLRLIHDSLEEMLRTSLAARGWFDAGRRHLPITMQSAPAGWDDPIPMNTIALSGAPLISTEAELGSGLTEDKHTFYIDFYAEDESLGMDVQGDLRDILRGKLPSIGRGRPILEVFDYAQATPPVVFVCELEDITTDRAHNFPHPWQRFWYVVRCDVVDTWGDETDE